MGVLCRFGGLSDCCAGPDTRQFSQPTLPFLRSVFPVLPVRDGRLDICRIRHASVCLALNQGGCANARHASRKSGGVRRDSKLAEPRRLWIRRLHSIVDDSRAGSGKRRGDRLDDGICLVPCCRRRRPSVAPEPRFNALQSQVAPCISPPSCGPAGRQFRGHHRSLGSLIGDGHRLQSWAENEEAWLTEPSPQWIVLAKVSPQPHGARRSQTLPEVALAGQSRSAGRGFGRLSASRHDGRTRRTAPHRRIRFGVSSSTRNALPPTLDVFGASNLDVIAADHLLDLPARARAIVHEHALTLSQVPHSRFTLEDLSRRGTGSDACGHRENESDESIAGRHDLPRLGLRARPHTQRGSSAGTSSPLAEPSYLDPAVAQTDRISSSPLPLPMRRKTDRPILEGFDEWPVFLLARRNKTRSAPDEAGSSAAGQACPPSRWYTSGPPGFRPHES